MAFTCFFSFQPSQTTHREMSVPSARLYSLSTLAQVSDPHSDSQKEAAFVCLCIVQRKGQKVVLTSDVPVKYLRSVHSIALYWWAII